ncbi:hypothetical protein E7T06_05735 [Deinococcus sp. Arct2-2]|uniref:hypothetical protein n=1 Tax=Deinococcus sp. Arct2-2 TaxID=2568653 RepID=UPI0010A52B7C|nr:hypothetical protein [Deinococcus sp. Arct2-2]THF70846.1 hypothetical protein E7T06_05735 [Deinococcus sp. Arct2-2]
MTLSYLGLITRTPEGYAGFIPELTILANTDTREQLEEALSQGLALHLLDAEQTRPKPRAHRLTDFPDEVQSAYSGREVEELVVTPAPVNPVSVQVERTLAASGMSYREVARRMGILPAALAQLADPFYWDHRVGSLRQLAAVLNLALDLAFVQAVELPKGAILGHPWGGLSTPKLRVRDVPEVVDATLPLTVKSELGTFRLGRKSDADGQAKRPESTVYDARELR